MVKNIDIQQSFIQIDVDLKNFCWKTRKHIYPWNFLEENTNKVNETSMFCLILDTHVTQTFKFWVASVLPRKKEMN